MNLRNVPPVLRIRFKFAKTRDGQGKHHFYSLEESPYGRAEWLFSTAGARRLRAALQCRARQGTRAPLQGAGEGPQAQLPYFQHGFPYDLLAHFGLPLGSFRKNDGYFF